MTQTLDPTDTQSTAADDPAGRVTRWLEAFQSALTARDVDRAADLV